MARQADIIAGAVAAHGGVRPVEQGEGDSVVAVFERASDALAAAVDAQLALAAEPWAGQAVTVRMGVHTGEAEFLDERTYGGEAIIRCARIRDLAQGGQVLVSAAAVEVAGDRLPPGSSLVPVGSAALARPARGPNGSPTRPRGSPFPSRSRRRADRLGAWPTRLIGRAGERAEVADLLQRSRLVTITGTGGAGKTRLAHAVANDLIGRHTDVVWVELARVIAEDDVAAVARRVGAAEAPGAEIADVLLAFLGREGRAHRAGQLRAPGRPVLGPRATNPAGHAAGPRPGHQPRATRCRR